MLDPATTSRHSDGIGSQGVPLPTVSVIWEVPLPGGAIGLGLKLAVVPIGIPVADRLTALLKPRTTMLETVAVPWTPWLRSTAAGVTEILKSGCTPAATVSVKVVISRAPPPVPVIVIGYVPTAVVLPTAMVIVEVPPPGAGMGLGLKLIVVPVGVPVAARLIALLKPLLIIAVIVLVACVP